jgi:TIR domain
MYFAQYDVEGTCWLQAAVDVRHPRTTDEEEQQQWHARFRSLLRNLDAVAQASTSLRIQLGDQLRTTLFAVAPSEQSAALRQALGSLTQLDMLADGEVKFAADRAEHDRRLGFLPFVCRTVVQRLARGEVWFSFDFRTNGHLNELLLEARGLGHRMSYHVNIERVAIERDWQRQAARNALRVADTAGVTASLAQLQGDLAGRLRHSHHVCEEYVGVDSTVAGDWLRNALEQRFRQAYGQNVHPGFQFEEHVHEGPLTATRHKVFFEPIDLDEICSSAITTDERSAMLAWQPAPELADLVPAPHTVVEEVADVLDHSGMPVPYAGNEPFIFVSYKRGDLARIKPALKELSLKGHRMWYDRGIPGGAEWDALIEQRVQRCQALLLFLSQAAVESKFVRREVKFADTLNKPIIAVRLDRDVDLSHGFGMLLNQYQMVDARERAIGDELDRAVRVARFG